MVRATRLPESGRCSITTPAGPLVVRVSVSPSGSPTWPSRSFASSTVIPKRSGTLICAGPLLTTSWTGRCRVARAAGAGPGGDDGAGLRSRRNRIHAAHRESRRLDDLGRQPGVESDQVRHGHRRRGRSSRSCGPASRRRDWCPERGPARSPRPWRRADAALRHRPGPGTPGSRDGPAPRRHLHRGPAARCGRSEKSGVGKSTKAAIR